MVQLMWLIEIENIPHIRKFKSYTVYSDFYTVWYYYTHRVKAMYYYSTVNTALLFLFNFIITYCYYELYQIRM